MSVTVTVTAHRTALQRLQPLDPAFQADWVVSIDGDASGGTATIQVDLGIDLGAITEYASCQDTSGAAVSANLFVGLANRPGPAAFAQSIHMNKTAVIVDTQTLFRFDPPRTMLIPNIGESISFAVTIVNPTATDDLNFTGRAYLWPRSEVIDLPQRTWWPYLTH